MVDGTGGARIEVVNGMRFVRSTVESLELIAAQRRKRRQDAMEAEWARERIAKRQCQPPLPNAAAPVPERTGCRCCKRVVVKSPFVVSSRRDTDRCVTTSSALGGRGDMAKDCRREGQYLSTSIYLSIYLRGHT